MRAAVLPRSESELWTDERSWILETWNHPDDPDVSLARARVEPKVATALHVLDVDERYVIVSGEGRVEVEGLEPALVKAGDVVLIPAGKTQRIANVGSEDLVFFCICTPRFEPRHYHDREGT
jgi:mannose-6-phosphate isomerase-like protein (cupin superfamily)